MKRASDLWAPWSLCLLCLGCETDPGPMLAQDAAIADGGRLDVDAGPSVMDAGLPVLDAGQIDASVLDAGTPNRSPILTGFVATPQTGLAPMQAVFTWTLSDPDGDPLACTLDPDGSGPLTGEPFDCTITSSRSVTYSDVGRYLALLRATDGRGGETEAQTEVRAQAEFALPAYLDADFQAAGAPVPDLAATEALCGFQLSPQTGEDITTPLSAVLADAAMQVAPGGHCVVRLPAGTFQITRTLNLRTGVVLRGAGASLTTLSARLDSAAPAVLARGGGANFSYEGEAVRGLKGARTLTVTATLTRQISELLQSTAEVYGELSIENDPAKFPAEWERNYAASGIGQVFRILSAGPTTLTLDRPLNEPYVRAGLARRLEVRASDRMVQRVGLADLRIVYETNHHVATVGFDRSVQAFMLRVALEKTGWAHLAVDRSLSCNVSQSYFFDAHDFGDGGRGYGVNLRHHTTGCRIEDNAFRRLRHAMILQLGSNGNVLGYNYAEDARDNLGWLKADISLHGHYTHMNLIEGNVVEKLHVSDWWGPAPYHVLFNNRVSRGGIFIDDHSEDCAVIDNVSEAPFPLSRPLEVHNSVQSLLCINNAAPGGDALSSAHSECDDENGPSLSSEAPRPASFYRGSSLMAEDRSIPAQRRLAAGSPVPAAP